LIVIRKVNIVMFQTDAKKTVLLIGSSGVLLLVAIAVVFLINAHFGLRPWNAGEIGLLWCFLIGCMVFPRALHRYRREKRRGERRIAWYRHSDLVLCLLGFVSGLLFILSLFQELVLSSDPHMLQIAPPRTVIGLDPFFLIIGTGGHVSALMMAAAIINFCWFVLALVLMIQVFKQRNLSVFR
jgi:hypothetical protein